MKHFLHTAKAMVFTFRGFVSMLVLASLLTMVACTPQSISANLLRASNVSSKIEPTIQNLVNNGQLPESWIKDLHLFRDTSKSASDAFRVGGSNRLELLATSINLLETLINRDAQLIKDATTRTWILAALAVADIALGEVSGDLKKEAAAHPMIVQAVQSDAPDASAAIEAFAVKPRLRCRSAKTGRFEKMSVCTEHPESTVVERVK